MALPDGDARDGQDQFPGTATTIAYEPLGVHSRAMHLQEDLASVTAWQVVPVVTTFTHRLAI